MKQNILVDTDVYKLGHMRQYPEDTSYRSKILLEIDHYAVKGFIPNNLWDIYQI